MKVKLFDYEDEKDLQDAINAFVDEDVMQILDIKFQVACSMYSEEQVYCFSAMICYREK